MTSAPPNLIAEGKGEFPPSLCSHNSSVAVTCLGSRKLSFFSNLCFSILPSQYVFGKLGAFFFFPSLFSAAAAQK